MIQPVRIENDILRVDVWPKLGGKVSSIVDKADGYELLFNFPAEIPTDCMYGKPYENSWYAGWDECFPGNRGGNYVGHPYGCTSQFQITARLRDSDDFGTHKGRHHHGAKGFVRLPPHEAANAYASRA